MVDKLHDYRGTVGQLHTIRDNVKSNLENWKESCSAEFNPARIFNRIVPERKDETKDIDVNFSHIHRKKTRWELIRLCSAVAGIEFSYAAITAFSSPILLENGVPQRFVSVVFILAPVLGFFLSPTTGSLSDRCECSFGRRRIFIVIFTIFELFGLLLIPYAKNIGNSVSVMFADGGAAFDDTTATLVAFSNETISSTPVLNNSTFSFDCASNSNVTNCTNAFLHGKNAKRYSAWVIVLTIIGIALSDYCADALQNPSRTYLLDVCDEEDHTRGLSTFTILAGSGGTVGYFLGSIDWDHLFIGNVLGGHVKTVFWMTSFLFLFLVILSITTFKEVPLALLQIVEQRSKELYCRNDNEETEDNICMQNLNIERNKNDEKDEGDISNETLVSYRETGQLKKGSRRGSLLLSFKRGSLMLEEHVPSLREYLKSIIKLPYSMRILLFTNVMCWMSHVSYSLYFTDYVGEAIFYGDPTALSKSQEKSAYEEGIRFACRGMAIYSFSCLICSIFVERFVEKFGLRTVYIVNISIDTCSMFLMFYFNSKIAVLAFSLASGILYCTIFTVPYILVARYHTLNVFEVDAKGDYVPCKQVRGIGTDISIIGSSVFIAQFFLSLFMSSVLSWYGSTRAVPLTCCFLSFIAALGATQVVYLDL